MSTLEETGETTAGTLRQIQITLRPTERFPVPQSDGYSVYASLLNVLSDADEAAGEYVHDSPLGSLHNSGLQGKVAGSERPHHKTLLPGETYELSLGIVNPDDAAVFQALVRGLVIEGEELELSHGTLRVERFESENTSHAELLDRAGGLDRPTIQMRFETATCIEEAGEVTTMFPYRWAVFRSLLGKWNRSCPDDLELDFGREDLLSGVIEKPDARTYDTHSVLVNRVKTDEGENRNLFRQGFTGTCEYAFKGASESVVNAVSALAMFGEYSGVGSAVARGCGNATVAVIES